MKLSLDNARLFDDVAKFGTMCIIQKKRIKKRHITFSPTKLFLSLSLDSVGGTGVRQI